MEEDMVDGGTGEGSCNRETVEERDNGSCIPTADISFLHLWE